MAIQQGGTNTGYRDPMKAMTIKALQDRQKAAALATAKSMEAPAQIASPWQGLAHLTGVLGAEYTQNRADAAEGDARNRLATIMAQIDPNTGATQQQLADASTLDPDFAKAEYARAMASREAVTNREDTQKAAADLQTSQQTFTSGQNDLNRQADVARQKLADANAAGRQDDAQAATVELANLNAEIDKTKATDAEQAKVGAIGTGTKAREEEWLRLNPGGDRLSPEAQAYILRDAASVTDPLGSRAARKDITDMQLQASHFDSALNNINQAKALVPKIITGSGNLTLIKAAMSLPVGSELALDGLMKAHGWTREQVDATTQFDRVMGGETVKYMSSTLKGQTSNYEMAHFASIMNDPNATPQQRLDALTGMENAIRSDRGVLSNSLVQNYGAAPLSDYTYRPETVTAPPVDAGGGGGASGGGTPPPVPAIEPGDEEGDTGSDEYGKLKVVNGKWTRI